MDDIGPLLDTPPPTLTDRQRYMVMALELVAELLIQIGRLHRNPTAPNGFAILTARRLLAALAERPFTESDIPK